jgi:hypothetical protein
MDGKLYVITPGGDVVLEFADSSDIYSNEKITKKVIVEDGLMNRVKKDVLDKYVTSVDFSLVKKISDYDVKDSALP